MCSWHPTAATTHRQASSTWWKRLMALKQLFYCIPKPRYAVTHVSLWVSFASSSVGVSPVTCNVLWGLPSMRLMSPDTEQEMSMSWISLQSCTRSYCTCPCTWSRMSLMSWHLPWHSAQCTNTCSLIIDACTEYRYMHVVLFLYWHISCSEGLFGVLPLLHHLYCVASCVCSSLCLWSHTAAQAVVHVPNK